MIRLEKAGAEDLETIIAIQRASFKAVYDKYQDEYDPYLEDRERIKWKLVERPNSYYYFVKENEDKIGFLRIQTNEELTEAWLGTAAILPPYQGKGYGSKGLSLLEKRISNHHTMGFVYGVTGCRHGRVLRKEWLPSNPYRA